MTRNNSLDITQAATLELNKYFQMKRIHVSANSLDFWKLNSKELPMLAILAKKHLDSPPSSSASEREFKIGKKYTERSDQVTP